jgi:hypothetical protein
MLLVEVLLPMFLIYNANDIMLSIAAKVCFGRCKPRQARIDTIGALHHVIIRGIERGKDLSV